MLGINTDLLNDSLSNWNSNNIVVSGNSLAQNLYIANFLKAKPGNKILFIELSRFRKNYPNSFNSAAKVIGFANFPDSYFAYVDYNQNLLFRVKNVEDFFIDWVSFRQNQLKQLLTKEKFSRYQAIGFAPISFSSYNKVESFITEYDIQRFSNEVFDKETFIKINDLLSNQALGKFKVVFFLPVTSLNKSELKFSSPLFHVIPLDSKWEYDTNFLKTISKSNNLMDKNHLNYQGSVIYTQGLIKYIKSNEASWQ
jgi:hypothetical protein